MPYAEQPKMPTTYEEFEIMRQEALVVFALPPLSTSPWINSEGAMEDMQYDLRMLKTRKFWEPGHDPITDEHRYNIAARFILRDLADNVRENKRLLRFSPRIWEVDDLYIEVGRTDAELGLEPLPVPTQADHITTSIFTSIHRGETPSNRVAAAALKIWQERGTIVQEMINVSDLMESAKEPQSAETLIAAKFSGDGELLHETHELPDVPSEPREMHFYKQYLSAEKNSHAFLIALLEDLRKFNYHLRDLEPI